MSSQMSSGSRSKDSAKKDPRGVSTPRRRSIYGFKCKCLIFLGSAGYLLSMDDVESYVFVSGVYQVSLIGAAAVIKRWSKIKKQKELFEKRYEILDLQFTSNERFKMFTAFAVLIRNDTKRLKMHRQFFGRLSQKTQFLVKKRSYKVQTLPIWREFSSKSCGPSSFQSMSTIPGQYRHPSHATISRCLSCCPSPLPRNIRACHKMTILIILQVHPCLICR